MKKYFSLDIRSLAFFRILISIIFFFDVLERLRNSKTFYTDDGLISRTFLIENLELSGKMTLLNLSGSDLFASLFMLIGLIASVFLFFGLKTKLVTFICWLVLCSLHARNPLVNHGGDNLLRMCFFWAMFLPLNSKYSLDAAFTQTKEKLSNEVYSIFTVAIGLQILFMYLFTFLFKLDPAWYKSFDSTYYAFHLGSFTTFVADYFLKFPILMKVLTFFTFVLEGLGFFIIFIPVATLAKRRIIMVTLFWMLHLGILATLHLGNFAYACLAIWTTQLPAEFWEYVKTKIPTGKSIRIFYDQDCGFCLKIASAVKSFLLLNKATLEKSQASEKTARILKEKNTWIVEKDGEHYTHYNAFTVLINNSFLKPLHYLFSNPISNIIGEFIYKTIAKNRGLFGGILSFIGVSEIHNKPSKIKKAFGYLTLTVVFLWNIEGLVGHRKFDLRTPINEFVFFLQLNQQWNMFAPSPMKNDGWVIVEGNLKDGRKWDVFHNNEYSEQLPKDMSDMYPNSMWRKYLLKMKNKDQDDMRRNFARYLCRTWNRREDNKLKTFKIHFMKQRTPKPERPIIPVKKITIWHHNCYL